jgi:hypothetical protein
MLRGSSFNYRVNILVTGSPGFVTDYGNETFDIVLFRGIMSKVFFIASITY